MKVHERGKRKYPYFAKYYIYSFLSKDKRKIHTYEGSLQEDTALTLCRDVIMCNKQVMSQTEILCYSLRP